MASSLALRLVVDDEGLIHVLYNTTRGGRLVNADIGYLSQPYGPGNVAGAAKSLVQAWLSPELAPDADQALQATFEALTEPF